MDNSMLIRDTVIQSLRKEKIFDGLVSVEINGNFFMAADIALPNSNGNCDIYRIAVVKHDQQRNFT